MLTQLLIASTLVFCTVVVTVGFFAIAIKVLTTIGGWLVEGNLLLRLCVTLAALVLWMLAALSTSVWIWAGAFRLLGLFETTEEAVYFAAVSFTTLGYGDIVLDTDWRLLSGAIAANGLILFSLVTALLIEFVSRLRGAQSGRKI